MIPLPGALGGKELVGWRLDDARFADSWDSGEGAFRFGGRWNAPGERVLYAALDPATAILEVAVHSGFEEIAERPHVLTSFLIPEISGVSVVLPATLPAKEGDNRVFGSDLLKRQPVIVIPSAVSRHSWNLLVSLPAATGRYRRLTQEAFVLDRRLAGTR